MTMEMDLSKVTLDIFTKLEQKWLSHCDTTRKTRILSIDGGGTTGIVAGASIIHLEDQIRLQTGDPHAQISDFFDLVVGTGIGGILAALLVADDGSGRPMFTARDAFSEVTPSAEPLPPLSLSSSALPFATNEPPSLLFARRSSLFQLLLFFNTCFLPNRESLFY